MAIDPGDAWRVHAALAHQLLDTWPVCPVAQQIIQSELEGWSLRAADNADTYLRLLIGRLRSAGVEQRVLDALDGVQDELEHVDEHLDSMFQAALALARDCYQHWADWSAASVDLAKGARETRVYPDNASLGELGVVACVPPREEPEAPAIVKLTFIPGLLGPPSWASVPYLLCHELICHVNQAAPMSSEDPFGGGWMDLVALQLHNHWAEEIFPWAPALARSAAARLSDDVLRRWHGLEEPHMTTRAVRSQGSGGLRHTGPAEAGVGCAEHGGPGLPHLPRRPYRPGRGPDPAGVPRPAVQIRHLALRIHAAV